MAEQAASSSTRRFRMVWEMLSTDGHCDGIGGAEYQRVWAEWNAAGQPGPIDRFIQVRANLLTADPWAEPESGA